MASAAFMIHNHSAGQIILEKDLRLIANLDRWHYRIEFYFEFDHISILRNAKYDPIFILLLRTTFLLEDMFNTILKFSDLLCYGKFRLNVSLELTGSKAFELELDWL